MTNINTNAYRVREGTDVELDKFDANDDGGLERKDGEARFDELSKRLVQLQELMYAQGKHALLVVFQAMDAGGKDSTSRKVIGPLNPAGVRVVGFKAPSTIERKHDFLWRVHQQTPRRGYISVFNRSHYEDVLVVRVKQLVEQSRGEKRYEHINAFEKLLVDEGTTIAKFYLHITRQYQKERLQRRLDRPDKHWKFNPDDLAERGRWREYQQAFETALSRCSTPGAPWYVVPAERRWFRNLLVAQVLADIMGDWDMQYPKPTFDPRRIAIE